MRLRVRSHMFAGAINYKRRGLPESEVAPPELGRAESRPTRRGAENRATRTVEATQLECPSSAPCPRSRAPVSALSRRTSRRPGRYFEGWRHRGVMWGCPVVAIGGLVALSTATTPPRRDVRLISDNPLIGVTFGHQAIRHRRQRPRASTTASCATSVPLTSSVRAGTVLSTNGLDGGLYPPGFAGRQSPKVTLTPRRGGRTTSRCTR